MLEWLKTILGDNYSEDTDKKVSEEIGKGFVAKADFTAAKEAKKTLEAQLAEAGKAIEGFKAMDIEGIKRAAEEYKVKAEEAEKGAATKIAEMEFSTLLDSSITTAKGKNPKAIKALLEDKMDSLKASKNRKEDITKALEALKADEGYMFDSDGAPPPRIVGGTGGKPAGAVTKEAFKTMSYKDRVQLQTTDPVLYNSMKE